MDDLIRTKLKIEIVGKRLYLFICHCFSFDVQCWAFDVGRSAFIL